MAKVTRGWQTRWRYLSLLPTKHFRMGSTGKSESGKSREKRVKEEASFKLSFNTIEALVRARTHNLAWGPQDVTLKLPFGGASRRGAHHQWAHRCTAARISQSAQTEAKLGHSPAVQSIQVACCPSRGQGAPPGGPCIPGTRRAGLRPAAIPLSAAGQDVSYQSHGGGGGGCVPPEPCYRRGTVRSLRAPPRNALHQRSHVGALNERWARCGFHPDWPECCRHACSSSVNCA